MATERVSLARLWALMATVFVDMMGFLMVMPVLPFYADRLGASPFIIGLMVSAFALAQLLVAPYWGKLSDRRGRRPTLMLGIGIATVAFLLLALACSEWAMARISPGWLIALIFVSRFVAGAGGATTGVVQAYVGDAIVPEERAKALGWISAATSAGVMLGPALGSLAAFGGPATPGLVATALCLLNLLFVKRWLPESSSAEARAQAKIEGRGSLRRRMLDVFVHPQRPVARLIWIYAVGMMAFMAMNAVLALFLQQRFGITEKSFGLIYTFVGAISLVMRSLLLGPAVRRLGESGVMRIGLAALAAGFAAQAVAPSLLVFFAAILFIPVGTALLFPASSSLVSRFAQRHELGATMGVQQAYGGVARLVGPMWAGFTFERFGPGAPFWISCGLAIATLVFAGGLHADAPAGPAGSQKDSSAAPEAA
ncbi:MAG: transporter [Acidobacteriota bacterium]|nr:transporter [Acidobacteriota bacterium]